MKTSNFSTSELEEYYNNNEIVFFHYRKCYILSKSNDTFKFTEFKNAASKPGELPHARKGRFYAFKVTSSYCKDYNFNL